jgi:hypothetical protein
MVSRQAAGWMRFFTRNELCIRRKNSVSQWLPDAYEEKILCFQKYIINLRRQHSYIVSQIGNADQTPVYFEMPLNTTVHKKGDKNVTVRNGGNAKQQCKECCTLRLTAENCRHTSS